MIFIKTTPHLYIFIVTFMGFVFLLSPFSVAENNLLKGPVTYIVDGDTFDVDGARIRLWGMNAPEREEHGYDDAKDFLSQLIINEIVECEQLYYDRYNRTVAKCYIDGSDVGQIMVLSGLAKDYKKYSDGYYKADETSAKDSGRGLWKGQDEAYKADAITK